MSLFGVLNAIFFLMGIASWILYTEKKREYERRISALEVQFREAKALAGEMITQAKALMGVVNAQLEEAKRMDSFRGAVDKAGLRVATSTGSGHGAAIVSARDASNMEG